MKKMTSTTKGYLFALITAVCWSLTGLFVKFINQSVYLIALIPAIIYGLYQSALPFAQFGISLETMKLILPDILWSTLFHFVLIAMKKWTGAMWLPIIVHAIIELSIYLVI